MNHGVVTRRGAGGRCQPAILFSLRICPSKSRAGAILRSVLTEAWSRL
jgi:hypothetical protein